MTTRRSLPNRRKNNTFSINVPGYNAAVQVTVGYFEDDSPAEVFVSGAKAGTGVDAILRDAAVILSIAMQYGVPLATLRHAVTRERDERASSVMGVLIDRLVAEQERKAA